jgi:hypothetical protein
MQFFTGNMADCPNKKLAVPTKRATIIQIKVTSYSALLFMLPVRTGINLKSFLSKIFLIVDNHHPDTLNFLSQNGSAN